MHDARVVAVHVSCSMQFLSLVTRSVLTDMHLFPGKESGHKTTLPNFLKARSGELRAEFSTLSHEQKGALLTDFLQAKAEAAERDDATKKISNITITKAVNAKLHNILSMVRMVCFFHIIRITRCSARSSIKCFKPRFFFSTAVVILHIHISLEYLQRMVQGSGSRMLTLDAVRLVLPQGRWRAIRYQDVLDGPRRTRVVRIIIFLLIFTPDMLG
jgi:hypothetical protein